MATLPSRRDSRRTKGDYLQQAAKVSKRDGLTEEQFVGQFLPPYRELARKAYQEAR
jgi:hypothetical protein